MRLNRDGNPFDIHSDAIQWRIKDDNNFLVTAVGGALITFPDLEVGNVHPDLPHALRLGVHYHANEVSPQDHVHKTHVRATYLLLAHGPIDVTDLAGNAVRFNQLFEVNHLDAEVVYLYGSKIRTTEKVVDGRIIHYVTDVELKTVDVHKEDLETLYPKWQERLAIGKGLQMNKHACMRYAFSKQETHMVELPDISFDSSR